MARHTRRTFLTAIVAALLLVASVAPATAGLRTEKTTGPESFRGFILTSGASGQRQVVASAVVAHGVFTGVGRIVEVPNRPSDPDSVSRDDLVFRSGTAHLVSVNESFNFSINPVTCIFKVTVEQTSTIAGGTGVFANASGTFDASVHATGLAARASDGSCSDQAAPLHELDVVMGTGSLTL
jgi:hypothetical protein